MLAPKRKSLPAMPSPRLRKRQSLPRLLERGIGLASAQSPVIQEGESGEKQSKSDQMMMAIREDLIRKPFTKPLQRMKSLSVGSLHDLQDEEPFTQSLDLRRLARNRRSSSLLPMESARSSMSDDVLMEPHELRKLRMLQSLERMGKITPRTSRSDSIQASDEDKILLQMASSRKRYGSLTSRTLSSLQRRNSRNAQLRRSSSLQQLTPLQGQNKDRAQMVLDTINKPEPEMKALPGLIGRQRASVTNEDIANEGLNAFRRRLRRKKAKSRHRFRTLARFLLVLLRSWHVHAARVNEHLDFMQSLDMMSEDKNKDLLFDITEYKADKKARISQDARRILRKRPQDRTDDECRYVEIALRNYKSIAEYPVHMQRNIARRAWFQQFGPKRVIIREGHLPTCFCFILSGSAIVSVMDRQKGVAKTVLFLGRGDSFGDLAIINKSRQQTTIISKETLELLCLTDEDFVETFMSGGLRDPNDPFLKSLSYFDGWPLEKLHDNPKKARFSFFKRNTILVKDSKDNDWIIVVKSGSCSLLKKLKTVSLVKATAPVKEKEWREKLMESLQNEVYLSHQEKLYVALQDKIVQLEQMNQRLRFYALPEIFVDTTDDYKALKRKFGEKTLDPLEKLMMNRELSAASGHTTGHSQVSAPETQQGKISSLGTLVKKGPYMTKSKVGTVDDSSSIDEDGEPRLRRENTRTVSFAFSAKPREKPKRVELPTYVNVQTLTKGMVFGISDLFYPNQPSMTLVSNGVECILISKKFFLEHASHGFTTRLRDETYPYPTDEDLQQHLETQVKWNHHKRETVRDVVQDLKVKRTHPQDSRAFLSPLPGF